MLNRNHLHLSSLPTYIKSIDDYRVFTKTNNTIELFSNILIIILMAMITIILVSFLIGPEDNKKRCKKDDKNK